MRTAFTVPFHCFVGTIITLTSTFVGERSIFVAYPEIMGCEDGCVVVATGWPLIFVTDYLGMSVVNTADILEVWFAADRFSWVPFLDSLLVSEVDVKERAPITIVALDLLHDVLIEGPTMIDDPTLGCIRDAVRTETLEHWTVGTAAAAARIDLCDPAQPTTTR